MNINEKYYYTEIYPNLGLFRIKTRIKCLNIKKMKILFKIINYMVRSVAILKQKVCQMIREYYWVRSIAILKQAIHQIIFK